MGIPLYRADEDMGVYQEALKVWEKREDQLRTEGLTSVLSHQCARRLGRTLTDAEQATLLARVESLGPDRLGDVILDLDGAQLGAWLADPTAR